jgi:hypothetical protein
MVGTSGNTSERIDVVTANGRSFPDLMCSSDVGTLSNITCTCPPSPNFPLSKSIKPWT